ncbi:hypothetical protein [Thermococcus zilligii]|uniref:hypothetical protein n=1 Tax=Thermococcus zilligii TaxID=54076 RepID=UPI00029AE892|nr:hypothetical protein [Thermococcus zilligii]
MRRGFVFTLDAMLSLVLVTLFITSMVAITESTSQVYSTYMRSQSQHVASDTLETLRTVSLNQLVPQEKINEWLKDGTLDGELVSPEMTPLDIVATYWATEPLYPSGNLRHKAEVILGYVLNQSLKGYNYELLINNYTSPYLRKVGSNYSKAPDVSPATLIMSGYAYNQTPRGYMARAYLTKATTTQERLYGWMRVLASGASSNTLTITRIINFPQDAQILTADGKFVARYTPTGIVTLNINGVSVSSSQNGQINLNNLANYLRPGQNNITLVYSDATGNEIGSGSGTTMYVKYKTDSPLVEDPGLFEVYDVTSKRTGFMYLFELFVPGNISSIEMKFRVRNVGAVRLYYGLGGTLTLLLTKPANPNGDAVVTFTDQEIKGALSNLGVSYSDLSKMVFDFVVGFDASYSGGTWSYDGSISNSRERRLYGYPDSYVRITYTTPVSITPYSIPLSVYFPYGDSRVGYAGNGLQVRYSLPPRVQPWYADWWVGYTFADSTTRQVLSENGREFYRGPLGRYAIRVAYTRLYDWMMVPGQENRFTISMENGNSYVRDGETRGIVYYFLQAYAGYGDVFPRFMRPGCKGYNITYYWQDSSVTTPQQAYILAGNEPYCRVTTDELLSGRRTYAVDDAIVRLFNNLGGDGTRSSPILVKLPNEVNIDFASMGNIPGLFQPIQITLRVWREG